MNFMFCAEKKWSTLKLSYISSAIVRENEYCCVSVCKYTRKAGQAVGNSLDRCQLTNVCEKEASTAAAHRPLSGVMATVLQVYIVY